MKQAVTIFFVIMLSCCSAKKSTFSEAETKIISDINFDQHALTELRQATDAPFLQFTTSDPGYAIGTDGIHQKTGVKAENGLSFLASAEKADALILRFKDSLKSKGYLIFVSEQGFDSPSTVSVIKSDDQFDILRIQNTDGINYDLENEDIIKTLQLWDKRFGIEILGADFDWVDVRIKTPVEDATAFAKEVNAFCPDAVEQGVGDIEELEKLIRNQHRLFLWWD